VGLFHCVGFRQPEAFPKFFCQYFRFRHPKTQSPLRSTATIPVLSVRRWGGRPRPPVNKRYIVRFPGAACPPDVPAGRPPLRKQTKCDVPLNHNLPAANNLFTHINHNSTHKPQGRTQCVSTILSPPLNHMNPHSITTSKKRKRNNKMPNHKINILSNFEKNA
jgi:hypothetical protein